MMKVYEKVRKHRGVAVALTDGKCFGCNFVVRPQMMIEIRRLEGEGMTFEQASAFAQSNGYTARVGSIDGESLPVTADYRPDRFTVSTVSGAVTSCTFG